ncbi:MAG TPA: HEAT repeat domain-containing protein [Bryobacteraceae bacterium]|nr:HEAT repeat domain-containing protein [Bryobacteraceae bacterium]
MLLRLGLNDESEPAEPRPNTASPPPPEDPVSSLEAAIQQLDPLEHEYTERPLLPGAAAVQQAAPQNIGEAVVYWLARYSQNPSEAARNIRELAARAPEQLTETALSLFQAGACGEGARFLASLLVSDRTVAKLCDPGASLEGSICAAKALMQYEPHFDARFAKSLLKNEQMTREVRQRGLAVLEKLGGGGRLIPILIQFMRDPDSHVRSKTALMFGQIMATRGIMDRLMADADARVRANFVEGLWNCPAGIDCRPLFRQALNDSNHRVAVNALVGLHRLGEIRDVVRHVSKMARRPEALFRAAVAWVMGETGDDRYSGVLRHMLRDPDPPVRLNALRSLRRISLASTAQAEQSHPDNATHESHPST